MQSIMPCLWFDDQAEEAVKFYTAVFKNAKVIETTRYPNVGQEIHGKEPGSVMTIEFELDGHRYTALNGGPHFAFNESISLQVMCESQDEVDYFWEKLGEGGNPEAQQCGWLKDKFGLSWQIIPAEMASLMREAKPAGRERVMTAMLKMKKLDVNELRRAAEA